MCVLESITLNNTTNSLCMLLVPLQYSPTPIHTLSLFILRTPSKVMDWYRECIISLGNAPASGFLGSIMILHNHLTEDLVEVITIGTTVLPDILMKPVKTSTYNRRNPEPDSSHTNQKGNTSNDNGRNGTRKGPLTSTKNEKAKSKSSQY